MLLTAPGIVRLARILLRCGKASGTLAHGADGRECG
jgi:hypothetical protein